MKYEYGVEYVNTTKPDLPDDALVQWRPTNPWCNEWFTSKVGELSWSKTAPSQKTFKIIDERYKPKPEDSTWFERGELPPAGTACEALFTPCASHVVRCIILDGKNIAYKVDKEWKTTCILYGTTFHPLKTEREKMIEAATKAAGDYHKLEDILGDLYDAGLLRLPEEK